VRERPPDWAIDEFEEFYRATHAKVYARARMLTRCPHDAEDLMQPAYIEALASWTAVLHTLALGQRISWMLTTITRMAGRQWRRNKTFDDLAPKLYEPDRGQPPDPETAALAGLPAAICLRIIETMDEPDRSICILCWVDGYRAIEIAEILGIPDSTVRGNLKRARDGMRRQVGPHLTFLPKYGTRQEGGAVS
jgi:RNA polymerase sigma-70 factor (ECF subfamily)